LNKAPIKFRIADVKLGTSSVCF